MGGRGVALWVTRLKQTLGCGGNGRFVLVSRLARNVLILYDAV